MSVIRLDLDLLVRNGRLSAEEAARLTPLALPERRGRLAVNLLLIFGSLAAALAAIALVPNALTGLCLAMLALAGAELLRRRPAEDGAGVLAAGFALMGILGLAGWAAWELRDAPSSQPALLVTFILTAGAIRYASAFLAALAVLALGAVFGSGTSYWHASYALFVEAPAITLAVFGSLAAGLWQLRKHVGPLHQGAVTTAARTSLILVHLAFWIGSLWGDQIGGGWSGTAENGEAGGLIISRWIFAAGWAATALMLAVAARRGGFVSVSAIVFLGIHFYTQYFERLGAQPASLLVAGLILLGLAVSLNWIYRKAEAANRQAHHTPSAE